MTAVAVSELRQKLQRLQAAPYGPAKSLSALSMSDNTSPTHTMPLDPPPRAAMGRRHTYALPVERHIEHAHVNAVPGIILQLLESRATAHAHICSYPYSCRSASSFSHRCRSAT
jgi:hypothetical protein